MDLSFSVLNSNSSENLSCFEARAQRQLAFLRQVPKNLQLSPPLQDCEGAL